MYLEINGRQLTNLHLRFEFLHAAHPNQSTALTADQNVT